MRNLYTCLIGAGCLALWLGTGIAGEITGVVKASRKKYVEHTVVYVDKIAGTTFEPHADPVTMDQQNMKFIPHVLPVVVGTTVDFLNADNVLHNVFTPEKVADKFNLGTWVQGEVRSYTFTKEGTAVLLCKVHPEMEAWVVVLQNPFFAVADKAGSFVITDVPAGSYTLKLWNKKLKKFEAQSIEVPAVGTVEVSLTIKR